MKRKIKLLRKYVAALVLMLIVSGFGASIVQSQVVITDIVGTRQSNSAGTKWRSHTKVAGYEDAGHSWSLKVYSQLGSGYASDTTTTGSTTVNSPYKSNSTANAYHEYYVGTVLQSAWYGN